MNILQIVSSSRISGAEKHVVVLSERLRQRGHSVTALCPPGGWVPDQLRNAGIEVIERPMHGLRAGTTLAVLPRLLREREIDLIHTHLTCATYYGCLLGAKARLPVVSSVHVRSHDFVYRRLFPRRNNHIITVSEWVRDAFLRQGVPPAQVHTIYNGTEFLENDIETAGSRSEALPLRVELSLPPEAELVGIFARVEEFKGHHILAQAMPRIVQARPNAYFVCVGAVEPAMQQTLWEIAAAGGVAERLRFTGIRSDVQRLMSAMDVMTLPSCYEACSMAIIEAMALGKTVIATRAGGNPELILDRETGLLIEREPDALAEALIAVLNDSEQRKRMGEAARLRAVGRFSAQVMVDNIEALYHQMLQAPSTVPML